ncbi:RNA polymerase III complex protein [Malassezia pachydermatis]
MATGGPRRGGRAGMGMFKGPGFPYSESALIEETSTFPAPVDGPIFTPPTNDELRTASLQLDFLRQQHDSPYWTRLPKKRVAEEEVIRYTYRYHPERRSASSAASFLQEVPLQPCVFPPQLWQSFSCNESKRKARLANMSTTSRIATIDWDNLHLEEKRAAEGEDEAAPESEEEDLGDYEDEVDDDYAQNYFDNGEDDDDIDADGGDEAAFD